jgi:cobalt-zinc-cadmium resistance protein CzcA
VVSGAVAVLVAALASVPFLGTEFMPELDEGSLLIETRRLPSVSLPQGQAIAGEVERTLMELPEVQTVVTNLGRPQLATEAMGLYDGDVYINFRPGQKPQGDEIEALIERMDEALHDVPGLAYAFSAPMAMRLEEAISGVRTDLGIKVVGDDLALLERLSEEIAEVVESIPGADDVSVGVSSGTMQLEIVIDRQALARYGLNVADVRRAVETGIGGREATEVIDGRRRVPVVVRMAEPYRNTPEMIGQLLLTSTSGAKVPLSQVAKIEIVEGPERILHEDGRRTILVQSNVRGRDLGSFVADVQREIRKQVAMPEGCFVTYSGQFENQQRAMARLAVIVPSVLLLVIGFLYAAFGNGRQAVLVMCNVPFALVGGIAALWLRDLNLSLSAAVGFIALFGVAVLNGVVLITHINQLRQSGHPLDEAVRTGAEVRLRPVLMTAIVASVGFLPMALSTSQGAEVQRPLATVVIGGIVTSTMLTLLVLPVLYEWLEARRVRRAGVVSHDLESGT